MNAYADSRHLDAADGRRLWQPAEGFLPIVLVVVLALTLGAVLDEPAWVDGRGALTDNLALCAALGAIAGFAGPKLGWGRWTTHVIGAVFAALILPIIAGWAVSPPGTSLAAAFHATASGCVQAYLDLAVRGRPFTTQEVHYVLVLEVLCWGTMQFASHAVFRHRRPLAAVVAVGLVLLGNMALTRRDQLGWLMLYTAVSLLLLVQMHAFDERGSWARRRIGDPSSMTAMYLRGGAVFIVLAMAGSLLLTSRAASAPLSRVWSGLDTQLVALGESIQGLFPVGGDVRGVGGVAFGSSARISGLWVSDAGVAFRATVPAGAPPLNWKAATYDTFVLGGWQQSDLHAVAVPAGMPLLANTGEPPTPGPFSTYQYTVTPDTFHDPMLLAPGAPLAVDQDASVVLTGASSSLANVNLSGGGPYTIQASLPILTGPNALTANELRAASQDYPAEIVAQYTSVPQGAIGPDAGALLANILSLSPSRNPYDLAVTMQSVLQSSAFTYSTDVRALDCTSLSAVECFARTRTGYCLHYASTMAILLRAAYPGHPIPTRLVQGFRAGTPTGGSVTVLNLDAHAWVEVYFPGYGWITFDPTGGGVGQPQVLQDGPPVAAATPTPAPTTGGNAGPLLSPRGPRDPNNPGQAGTPGTPQRPLDQGLLLTMGLLLALLVGAVSFLAWWRGPRGEVSAEHAWSSLARGAARYGVRQRPTQTIYEYAGTLGDLLPVARGDLRIVADATVEATYGGADLEPGRLEAVRVAMRRLRLSMVRLVFRRRRPSGPRGPRAIG